MNWEAAGALGEIIGAIAVIATLAFLAAQIRQGHRLQRESNVLARSAAVDRIHDQLQDFARLLASDSEAVRIWLAGCAGEELGAVDQERFNQLARFRISIFTGWEQRAVAVNMLGTAELAIAQLVVELRRHPGLQGCWEQLRPTLLGRIRDAVAAELAREGGAAPSHASGHDHEGPAV
jgi:hypothetical protein